MGAELLVFSYAVGLVAVFYGLYVIVVGRIYLTPRSSKPIRGIEARLWGLSCLSVASAYYAVITWAWSIYDR